MKLYHFYIDNKIVYRILTVVLVLAVIILLTNYRIEKNKIKKPTYVGTDADIEMNGDAVSHGFFIIYDFDLVEPYFVSTEDAIEFRDYIQDFILNKTQTALNELWVTNVSFNSTSKELSFYLMSNEDEYFKVVKNNKETTIKHTHEKYNQNNAK